jgi:iron(III) transport system ATP-binding protein
MASSCAASARPSSSNGSGRPWRKSASPTSPSAIRTSCRAGSSSASRSRALVYEPAVILLDEPLSNLDAKLREEARAWLRQLIVSLALSALLVTHDQIEAMAIADRIVLLDAGAVEQEGTPTELYQQPASLFAAEFMGNNNRLEGTLVERTDGGAVIAALGARLEGRARTAVTPGAAASGVIRVEKVTLADGPGANRVAMTLKTQMYIGERWELVFVKDGASVRAYTPAPLADGLHNVEFPPSALWIF